MASPTSFITPVEVPPVRIQVPGVLATLTCVRGGAGERGRGGAGARGRA